ncbi:restriction endonuclease subunit S [Acinetobacter junii]|uniref:restriction endonuclease subunit S n=1 Tax=Acinetobacter junii TaxID=40215 RepID=UPI00244B9201|nr:restriction endonuclease subunit S [Acinetobacter junii]MDH1917178.1 restriction endonuclease subunit S [Acinetobacter junii]
MAKYQAYAEYKDSEVEWLGEIPSHWKLTRLKFLAKIRNGQDYKHVETETGFPVMGSGGQFTFSSTYMFDRPSVLLGRKGTIDKPLYIDEPFWTVDTMYYTEVNKDIDVKYFYYLSKTILFNRYSTNTALPSMTQENLNNFEFSVPPSVFERNQIRNFLDHETTKIDHLIEKQQQLIELLKEKRQAVISHAVTKGLDPNVPMKDSGVEWLGAVPEHWTVSKLKYIKSHEQNAFVDGPFGSNLKSEHFVEDGDVYVIESNFATTGNLETSNLKRITTKHFETICRSEAKGGDIIIAKIGARFGSSSILPILDKKAVVSGNSLKLTVNCKICDVNYANKLLQHLKNEGAIDDGVNGSAQPALSLGGLNTLPFLLPPLDEQIKIIQSLDLKVSKIDQVISQVKKQILLMQERRTALISAAVTGKIDVRNWQAPTLAEADTELSA